MHCYPSSAVLPSTGNVIASIQWNPAPQTPLKSTHLQYSLRLVSNAFTYNVCIQSIPLKCGTTVFRKADRFSSPNSTWTVQNSLDNVPKIVRHLWWIQRPGIILALSFIVLTFLNIARQRLGPKMWSLRAQQPKNGYLHILDTHWWSQRCPL